MSTGVDRRDFLKIAGAGVATTAATACSPPRTEEKIVPHVKPSPDQIPGQALWYNSTCAECAAGCGIRVRNREGRALRIEGNPEHPVNQGGLCVRGHSALQASYHPDRFRGPKIGGKDATWADAIATAVKSIGDGTKTAVLTGALPEGTFARLVDAFAESIGARRFTWQPVQDAPLAAAAASALGVDGVPTFRFDAADYVLGVGADFLDTWGNPVANQKRFAQSHGYRDGSGKLTARHVQLESRLSVTAANADEWLPISPGSEASVLAALLGSVLNERTGDLSEAEVKSIRTWLGSVSLDNVLKESGLSESAVNGMVRELLEAKAPLVVAGGAAVQGTNATQLHALALLLNRALGVNGTTVVPVASAAASSGDNLEDLLAALKAGEVATIVLYGANPVYDGPAGIDIAAAFDKATVISLDALPSETNALADVVLPDHGALEKWGDHLGNAGVASLRQPAMNPLFDTREAGDTLIALASEAGKPLAWATFLDAIKDAWKPVLSAAGVSWREAVRRGGVFGEATPVAAAPRIGDLTAVPLQTPVRVGDRALRLVAYPHIHRYDGSTSNRGWCQEIPDPLMQAAWSHWVEIHPSTAKSLGIGHKDRVRIETDAGAIETFAYLTSGVLPGVLATPLGQGHGKAIGRFGGDIEGNVYALVPSIRDETTGARVLAGVTADIRKVADADLERITGISYELVTTDGSKTDLGRGIAQVVAADTIARVDRGEIAPEKVVHHGTHVENPNGNYPPQEHPYHRWAMSVDLNRCTGCAACVAACYSENNVPVVGKDLVGKGREMAWIRIERYYDDADDAARGVNFVPVMCQQCDNAPCEPVCPVIATYHTVDGLNGMVYNRCVGTRYCGNNCSYKVRRFNYFDYGDPEHFAYAWPEPMNLMLNPDLTVRSDGVMEKCTFCVQIIREHTEHENMTGEPIKDGTVRTACQASCPSDAIVFGDLLDENSEVARKSRETNRGYKLLDVLNTQPAVTYQKRVRHPKTLA
ncbi:MAG: 4Fe-4S dicluster domain-containing protein [Candidatus Dadabacteria bacterium]|nr:MAG: 4Fe-4S dicluster domain-containing protein [Candidatus Dadabacteria bacterium]